MIQNMLNTEFMRTMSFMQPRMWRYAPGVVLMTLFMAGMAVFEAFSLRYVMNAAIERDLALLVTGIGILLAGALLMMIFFPIFRYMYQSAANVTAADIRLLVFRHILHLPVDVFERLHSGDMITRMTTDTGVMVDLYTHKLRRFVAPFIFSFTSGAAMMVLDWRIATVLIAVNLLAVYINTRFILPVRHISDAIQESMGALTEKLIDFLAGFRVIRLFHLYDRMLSLYGTANQRVTTLSTRRYHIEGVLDGINFFFNITSTLGTIVVGAYLVLLDVTDFGTLLALITLQSRLNQALLQSASYLPQVQKSLAGAQRVFELLDMPAEPERYGVDGQAATPSQALIPQSPVVQFQHVGFQYTTGDAILNELSLIAEEGQTIALVGPSGGGKSTILKLLLGYYPVQSGKILVNGTDLGTQPLTQLRNLMAYVPQDAYLFDGTVAENIRFGNMDAAEAAIIRAAKAAYAHEFVMQLPAGYETLVGERGTKLSGGQRQRIAIARALIKDAPILLLDEATSALDSQSEQWVQQALETLMQNRTTLVIAHRLSTIQHADRIYVIDNGQVVEAGLHDDLLNQAGLYARLQRVYRSSL